MILVYPQAHGSEYRYDKMTISTISVLTCVKTAVNNQQSHITQYFFLENIYDSGLFYQQRLTKPTFDICNW